MFTTETSTAFVVGKHKLGIFSAVSLLTFRVKWSNHANR